MAKNKIYEYDLGYAALRPIVDWCCRMSYRKTQIVGRENLPDDGPYILAPNHCNTLMDALVILRARKAQTVFGARADMFKNPLIAKMMFFFRILPMVRQRDGLRNVLKNHDSTQTIVETLEHGIPFCMFPEGRHRPAHSLLPLGKGVFRAALEANRKFGGERPVYIVPVGLEYGDYFRYRSTSLITYGQAINVTEFIKKLDLSNEVAAIEPLRNELASRISGLITYLSDDGHLDEKWTLVKMLAIESSRKGYGDFGTELHDCMLANRAIAARVDKVAADSPEQMEELYSAIRSFDKERRSKGISIYSFTDRNTSCRIFGKSIAAVLGLPYFLFSAIVSLPMWATFEFLRRKLRDRAFHNTAGFGVKLAGGFLMFIIWSCIAFSLLPWMYALVTVLLTIPAYGYVYDYAEGARRYVSDIRLKLNKTLKDKFRSITSSFNRLSY